MKIALVTDAWTPQVNGVVRTLTRVVRELRELGARNGRQEGARAHAPSRPPRARGVELTGRNNLLLWNSLLLGICSKVGGRWARPCPNCAWACCTGA